MSSAPIHSPVQSSSPSLRSVQGGTARYAFTLPGLHLEHVLYSWQSEVDDQLAMRIIALMRLTTSSAPVIGFGQAISDEAAASYIRDLRDNLAAGKCTMMTIEANSQRLIGLCTLRRNLNPNNAHIADLAKGMIDEAYRGYLVLPAAFYEISLRCEDEGVDLVTLDVRSGTQAHRSWERFGFETYGVLPDYARVSGKSLSGHFMMQTVEDLKARALTVLQSPAQPRAEQATVHG